MLEMGHILTVRTKHGGPNVKTYFEDKLTRSRENDNLKLVTLPSRTIHNIFRNGTLQMNFDIYSLQSMLTVK